MSAITDGPMPASPRAEIVWLVAVAAYALAVFHRLALGVAGLDAAERFQLTASQLSMFTVVQLATYAALQIPVGALIDAFGASRLLLVGTTLMSAAQLGFATTDGYGVALAARMTLGAGDALVFVSVCRIVASWFPGHRVAFMTALTGTLGQLGAICAAIPLSRSLAAFGWTPTFAGCAAIGVGTGLLTYLVVHDGPMGPRPVTTSWPRVRASIAATCRDPGIRLAFWAHLATLPAPCVFSLLWGFPYLTEGERLPTHVAARILTLAVVSMLVTGPIMGLYIGRHPWRRSSLVLAVVGATSTVWTVALLWPGPAPVWLLATLAAVTGLGGSASFIAFDLARTFSAGSRLGLANGIVNLGGFAASLTCILLVGVILDGLTPGASTDYTARSYRMAMCCLYVVWVVGAVQVLRYRARARAHLFMTQPALANHLRGRARNVNRAGVPAILDE